MVRATPRQVATLDFERLGQTEVEGLDVIVAGDYHVLGLEIAMGDAAGVRRGDGMTPPPPGDLINAVNNQ